MSLSHARVLEEETGALKERLRSIKEGLEEEVARITDTANAAAAKAQDEMRRAHTQTHTNTHTRTQTHTHTLTRARTRTYTLKNTHPSLRQPTLLQQRCLMK